MPALLSASSFLRRGLMGWARPGSFPFPHTFCPSPSSPAQRRGSRRPGGACTSGAQRAPSRRAWARPTDVLAGCGIPETSTLDWNYRACSVSPLGRSRLQDRKETTAPARSRKEKAETLSFWANVCEMGRTINLLHEVVKIKFVDTVQPVAHGMCPRMAGNAAQHKIVNLLKT